MVIGMIIGVLAFGLISLVVHLTTGPLLAEGVNSKSIWAIMLVVASIVISVSQFHYNRRMSLIADQLSISTNNRQQLTKITLLHTAICETIGIIAVISFLLLGNYFFFLPAGMSLVEMTRTYYKVKSI